MSNNEMPSAIEEKEEIPKITNEEWKKYADLAGNIKEITDFAEEKGIKLNNEGWMKIEVDGETLELSTDVEDFFTQKVPDDMDTF